MDSPRPFRLFLAHSFAKEQWNNNAQDDPQGISDLDLANKVTGWLEEHSHGAIEVIRTRDPLRDYVSSRVRQDISSSDGVLCLFTKRVKDCITNFWIPSTYVVSEGAAALSLFSSEDQTHERLFGFVEEGVDANHLGMAFHGNKTAPRFRRDDLSSLESRIKELVGALFDEKTRVPRRDDFEYMSLDKVVSIWRNGNVLVETRHRFRSTTARNEFCIPHKVWRFDKEVPDVEELQRRSARQNGAFLRVIPLRCGEVDLNTSNCKIMTDESTTEWGYERKFFVDFRGLHAKPGDELEYEVVWGYAGAFDCCDTTDEMPNAVGLTTDGRGQVRSASLTLKFQRDLDGECDRTIEELPKLSTTETVDFPGAHLPYEFFHKDRSWKRQCEMQRCRELSCALYDVYRWSASFFHGMAKAEWSPYLNYFEAVGTHSDKAPK